MTKNIFNLFLTLMMSLVLVVGCLAQKDKPPERPKEKEKVVEKEKPKPTPPPDRKKPN